MSLQEVEQEPFNVHEFIERLAWRTIGTKSKSEIKKDFDPDELHDAFEHTIKELKEKNDQIQRKVERLENSCKEEEKRHWQRVSEIQKRNQAVYSHFQELEERIVFVATKVVHLGDQLEGVNIPRARAAEAHKLMNYLKEFLRDGPPKSAVFTDPFQLQLAADIIQKLHLIALELPLGGMFDKARRKIADKYDQIEKELIEEFRGAHHEGDRRKMKRVATVLSNFKGYGQCIDAFIEESQKNAFIRADVFEEVVPICRRTNELVHDVFSSPDTVMGKLVQNIYSGKLQTHVSRVLEDRSDLKKYLENLNQMYMKTSKLSSELSIFKLGNDSTLLNKLTKNIFHRYLDTYIDVEIKYLRDQCAVILQRFYESKDHQKKQIQTGGIYDLKRDLQAKLGTVTKANINIGPAIETYGGETFLSQEAAINILQESKTAFKRCHVLSSPNDCPTNAVKIFEVLIQYLVIEHIDYAIEIGLQAIPIVEPKSQPELYFFDVTGQANSLFHWFEKQFMDSLVPLILSSPRHTECLHRKRNLRESMEGKIDTGLERMITMIAAYVRYILSTEQKKTDFKPEDSMLDLQMVSPACKKVVKFLLSQVKKIRDCLDGKNVEVVLMELGTRLHRILYDHVQQFQYNAIGATVVLSDVTEYRGCIKEFNIPFLVELFNTLYALCNLLIVKPENLKQLCTEDILVCLDRSVLLIFVQLRADYKSARINALLK